MALHAEIQNRTFEYKAGDTTCEGFVAYDDSVHYLYNISLSVHFDHSVKIR